MVAWKLTESTNVIPGLRDILAPNLHVVFCGINPGLRSAALGHHFAGRGNRFWKTIHLAGFTREQIALENGELVLAYRCGLTTAVERATSPADELSRDEFERAVSGLSSKIARYSPKYIAFLGKPAFARQFSAESRYLGTNKTHCLEDRRLGSYPIPVDLIVPFAWINWFALTPNFALSLTESPRDST
jgi:mismatch-specific thymine-DNA glycosylase